MLHTQEVIGSRPVGPIYSYNNLGGAEWPAFFMSTRMSTRQRLGRFLLDSITLRLAVAGIGFLRSAVYD
jgi:hypothetical protein